MGFIPREGVADSPAIPSDRVLGLRGDEGLFTPLFIALFIAL